MQNEELACLPVGTEVSAKYKGAFCEAKVKKVMRQVKCRVTFKQGLGSFTLCDSLIKIEGSLVTGATVEARHPEKLTFHEAIVNKIQDQSQYTVVFDDGDIATLRRNALCMKSGKHFNASESLDNLPLTHPEHFGTPVGSKRRGKYEDFEDEESSDGEGEIQSYLEHLGRVVCVELTDKKQTKMRESWFPGLVVSPNAQEIVKINAKEDYLIRSFKDHRYYTVPKKETKKFHRDSARNSSDPALVRAVENAVAFMDYDVLPVHWDREILFKMKEESSTEGSSEEEADSLDSDDEDTESPEEKDHLVAELYKHMDDRGTPINRTPSIGNSDVDLYKLFKLVQKLGGQNRVTSNNQWRQVAKRLGFDTNWCVNQVRVCYKRYLQSFEELYRTLGCTLVNHPRGNLRIRHSSGRPLVRGVRSGSKLPEEDNSSDRSSVSSQDSSSTNTPASAKKEKLIQKGEIKEELIDEIDLDVSAKEEEDTKPKKKTTDKRKESSTSVVIKQEALLDVETEISDKAGAKVKEEPKETKKVVKKAPASRETAKSGLLGRSRRDSSSGQATAAGAAVSAAATPARAIKEESGSVKKKETTSVKKEPAMSKKVKEEKEEADDGEGSDGGGGGVKGTVGRPRKHPLQQQRRIKEEEAEEECSSDLDSVGSGKKKNKDKNLKKRVSKADLVAVEASSSGEEPQHLKNNVVCSPGDKIKVFWLHGQIYEAKIIKQETLPSQRWPKFFVHYLGWNSRYDEWISRGRIAENLSWQNGGGRQHHGSSGRPSASSPKLAKQQKPDRRPQRPEDEEDDMEEEEEDDEEQQQQHASEEDMDEEDEEDEEEEDVKVKQRRRKRNELEAEEGETEVKKKKDEPAVKKEEVKLKARAKARSATPSSSTPTSSRTSSPAANKRPKSPPAKEEAEEQQLRGAREEESRSKERKEKKRKEDKGAPRKEEKEEEQERKAPGTARRTGSPSVGKTSPSPLKRQSSRNSVMAKCSDEENSDSNAEEEGEEEPPKRRSTRSERATASGRDVEEEEERKVPDTPRSSARLRPATPNSAVGSPGGGARTPHTPSRKAKAGTPTEGSDDPYDFKEPEPCDPQTRYETTPKKQAAAASEECQTLSPREPKKEAKNKEPEPKKEPEDEEDDEDEKKEDAKAEAVAIKPKGQRGRKRKSAAVVLAEEPSSEAKTEKMPAENQPESAGSAAAASSPIKQEAAVATSSPVLAKTELKREQKKEPAGRTPTPEVPKTGSPPLSTSVVKAEEATRPLGRHPLPAVPLVPSRSAVLFPHLAALSARPPSLGKSALQAAAKPLMLSGLKGSSTTVAGSTISAAGESSGGLGLTRIGQPVVSLKAVSSSSVTSATLSVVTSNTAKPVAATAAVKLADAAAVVGSSPAVAIPAASSTLIKPEVVVKTETKVVLSAGPSKPPSPPLLLPPTSGAASFSLMAAAVLSDASILPPPITSAAIISTIVGNVVQESLHRDQQRLGLDTVKEEEEDNKRRMKEEPGIGAPATSSPSVGPLLCEAADSSPADTKDSSMVSPNKKSRKKTKIRGPRNFNLKSREVVSDTDSDSSPAGDEDNSETTSGVSPATSKRGGGSAGGAGSNLTLMAKKRRRTTVDEVVPSAKKGGKKVQGDDKDDDAGERRRGQTAAERRRSSSSNLLLSLAGVRKVDDEEEEEEEEEEDKDDTTRNTGSLVCDESIPGSSPDLKQVMASSRRMSASPVAGNAPAAADEGGDRMAGLSTPKEEFSSPSTPDFGQEVAGGGTKSPNDSSEGDLESLNGERGTRDGSLDFRSRRRAGSEDSRGRRAGSEDSRLDVECSSSSDTKVGRGRRRRILPQDSKSSQPAFKRKRRTRESIGRGRGASASKTPRGRMAGRPGRGASSAMATAGPEQDSDEDSETAGGGVVVVAAASPMMMGTRARSEAEVTRLDRLDNAALAALAQPRPNVASKYNFYVQLDPSMEQAERIQKLQKTLEDLRKTYNHVKGELSALERRRKKMRRKDKDRAQKNQAELAHNC